MARRFLWIGVLATLVTSAFAETRTISWDPVTSYTDGTPIEAGKTVTYTSYWTTDPGLGSLRNIATVIATTSAPFDPDLQGMTRGGTVYFTAKAALNTGEESALSPAYAWVVPVVASPPPPPPAPGVLIGVTVSGLSSMNEGGTGTYTATGTWDNGSTGAVTPTWSVSNAYATISSGGLLTASAVTSNQTVTVTASYGGKTGTMNVTIINASAVLTGIAVSGPTSVNESATGSYTATGTWDNGTTTLISPVWSVSSTYASISSGGLLTSSAVTSNQAVTVTASSSGKTGTMSVTIVDVPEEGPATPKNVGITGPIYFASAPSVSSPPSSSEIWRIKWDPVTSNRDGTPIDPARTVRYTAYWTDDPTLSSASLRPLASLISGTALDFDPSKNQMVKNQLVYLTVQAILDTGLQSSLAASLNWRVENAGPVPPAKGRIIKK